MKVYIAIGCHKFPCQDQDLLILGMYDNRAAADAQVTQEKDNFHFAYVAEWEKTINGFKCLNELPFPHLVVRSEHDAARYRELLQSLSLQIARGQIAQAREDIDAALKEWK